MAAIEQIRRVVTQYESSGAEKAAADFNAVAAAEGNAARAGEQLATVTDMVSKRQLSAAAAYDRLRRSIDEDYRAQQQLAKGQATLDRAMQQGAITADEYNRSLSLLNTRFATFGAAVAPVAAVGKATKLATHEATNLAAQVQDIGVSLAGGQSPFLVMMQQGSQISQIMGDRGLKSIMQGLGGAILSMVNPTTLALAAFTALYVGGTYAYEALIGSSKSLDDQLKTQQEIIKQVKGAYDEATGAATKWVGASRAASTVRASASLKELNAELDKASQKFLQASGTFTLLPDDPIGKDVFAGARAEFSAFADEIAKFQASAKDPAAWRTLEEGIGAVAEGNPALTDAAGKLLALLENGLKAATGVESLDAALRALRGTADSTDLSKIGLDRLQKDAESAAKTIAKLQSDIALIGNDRQKAINDAVAGLGQGAGLDATATVASLAGQKYDREKAAQEAEKAAREAQGEAKRASDDLAREGKRVWEDTRTAAEDYAAEIAKLNDLLAKGAITQDTYARATAKAAQEMEKARAEEYRKGLENSSNPYDGVTLAAMDYQKNIGSMAKQTADATTSMISSMEDAFVDFVKTGKVNFSDLVDSMIADLARFAFQQAALGLMGMLGIGGSAGSSLGTVGSTTGAVYVAGSHTGGVPGAGEATFYRRDDPALYLNAQRFHTGRDPFALMAGERRAIIKNDEGVFTAGQMRALGARMGGGDTIAPVFSPVLTINGGGGQSVAEQRSEMVGMLDAWWKTTRRDVVNVLREARAARVKGV